MPMNENQESDCNILSAEKHEETCKTSKGRGFASMSVEQQREIARKGGKAAHQKGTAHEFTPEEARIAGRKGGER
jgi:uncharacterized protein